MAEMAGHVAQMEHSTNAYIVLVERPEGKRPLGRPRHRREDNFKINIRALFHEGTSYNLQLCKYGSQF